MSWLVKQHKNRGRGLAEVWCRRLLSIISPTVCTTKNNFVISRRPHMAVAAECRPWHSAETRQQFQQGQRVISFNLCIFDQLFISLYFVNIHYTTFTVATLHWHRDSKLWFQAGRTLQSPPSLCKGKSNLFLGSIVERASLESYAINQEGRNGALVADHLQLHWMSLATFMLPKIFKVLMSRKVSMKCKMFL